MLRFITRRGIGILNRPRTAFNFSTNPGAKDNQVPAVAEQNFPKQRHVFLSNVYGIEVKKHVFPNMTKPIELSDQELKFYQRNSPNYVVAMVRKVLDQADFPEDSKSDPDPLEKYYQICSYCNIEYKKEGVVLTGLYRSRIKQIQKLHVQNVQPPAQTEQQFTLQTQQEQSKQVDGFEQSTELSESNQFSISDMIGNSRKRKPKKKNLQFFSLKIQKLEELPLVVTPHLEMKFKFLIETYMQLHQVMNQNRRTPVIFNIIDIGRLLDQIATECSEWNVNKEDVQGCLQALDRQQRTQRVQKLIQKTRYFRSYLGDIERAAQNNLRNKKIHEYYSEMLKIGKQLLDGKKTKQIFLERVTKDFYSNAPPEELKQVFEAQKQKYQQIDENSMQSGVIKTYIEQLSKIPYGVKSDETFDLQLAKQILEEQHYGMEEAKAAILEIIAVGKLKKTLKGKIFCFVGGPGLGKTTFAKSIAKALNRKFYNISLGGVTDSSVLKGHRRTYIGAYSGKIIEALKNCGVNNPVILLDEIDKMGSGSQGDPRSQLLEILDPNQNNSFVDNFVDVPVDLSNVLFICSANYEDNISKPLLDRVEKIKLTSYTNHQKKEIFKRHLLRRSIQVTGVQNHQFDLDESAIDSMIQNYSLGEPGVRYLQKHIALILEKVAYKIVTQETLPIRIDRENLNKFIGNSYRLERNHHKIEKGVAISLGGGRYGGRLTYIEAFKKSFLNNKKDRKREFMFTGSLGDVFKEAMNISYTYARNFLAADLGNKYLYQNEVHIHAPQGASKKDGSTDSLTITSALISLALGKQVKKGVALTGQLTLHGKVLRTNLIKEKILVAKREKITEVIIPAENYTQVEMLKDQIKEGMQFHFVKEFSQVYKILF